MGFSKVFSNGLALPQGNRGFTTDFHRREIRLTPLISYQPDGFAYLCLYFHIHILHKQNMMTRSSQMGQVLKYKCNHRQYHAITI